MGRMTRVQEVDEKKIRNKVATINLFSTLMVIILAYLVEVIKNSRTVPYYLVLVGICLIPLVSSFIIYFRKPQSQLIGYFIAYGYLIVYAFVMFTTVTPLAFIYLFPILSSILVYSNVSLVRNFSIISTVIVFANVVYHIVFVKQTASTDIVNYEIQIFGTLLVCITSYFVCRVLTKINTYKMALIEEKQASQEKLLKEIISTSRSIAEQIADLTIESQSIEEQSENSKTAVVDIANGTGDLVNNIQSQMEKSNIITALVDETTVSSKEVKEHFDKTIENTELGMANVMELNKSAQETEDSNRMVNGTMHLLSDKTNEVKDIIEMINNITKQTHLLSLNAAIEAARAGESGRGFAVVADEISKLANDTQSATESINEILTQLSKEADNAVAEVEHLNEVSVHQNELIEETRDKFMIIESDIEEIAEKINKQTKNMEEVNRSNKDISQSIEFMSAFSEELMANTESTKELVSETLEGTEKVNKILAGLLKDVKALKQLTQE